MYSKIKKISKIAKNPRLFVKYYKNRKRKSFNVEDGEVIGIVKKKYNSYKDYTDHQKAKLETIDNSTLSNYDKKFGNALMDRLKTGGEIKSGVSVLCLAARTGTEVKSFINLGCFAVGIDLNPGKDNKFVLPGDFHNLQYADNCVNVVFTNSIDHSFDVDKLIAEVKRVLKPGGYFINEIAGANNNKEALKSNFEAIIWDDINIMVNKISEHGFKIIKIVNIEYPWEGKHVIYKLV